MDAIGDPDIAESPTQDGQQAYAFRGATGLRLSIIIPVRNRWGPLVTCLEALAQQKDPPEFEIVIVDDGSDSLFPWDRVPPKLQTRLRLVRQTPLGISAARNAGVGAATGEVLVFVDSDCVPHAAFLRRLTETIDQCPQDVAFQAGLVGGESTVVGRMEGLRLAATLQLLLKSDGHVAYLNTSGAAFWRSYANRFQEFFDVGVLRGEDTIVLARLAKERILPRFVSDAVVEHRPIAPVFKYVLGHFWIGYHTGYARDCLNGDPRIRMSFRHRRSMLGLMWDMAQERKLNRALLVLLLAAYVVELCGRGAYRLLGMRRGRVDVLSLSVDPVRTSELVYHVLEGANRRAGARITYLTAWTLVQAAGNVGIRDLIRSFDVCYADGMGVVLALFLTSCRRIKKVTANDFFEQLCQEAAYRKLSIALIGGEERIAGEVADRLRGLYPALDIRLTAAGYFGSDGEESIIHRLRESDPHIVFVGMGQPRQEQAAQRWSAALPRQVFFCVGGLFDVISGRVPSPPRWVRKTGFEWLFRLVHSPRLLWRRYLVGIPLLTFLLLRDQFGRARCGRNEDSRC